MSQPRYFSETSNKSEVGELKKLLDQVDVQRDPVQYKKVIQKVIACMTLGMDVSSLFMQMIKAGATNDLVQKKLVYLYVCTYAKSNPQLALLTVNTLTKDTQDSSAMVRGLALRSMSSLRLPDLLEYIEEPVIAALQDPSHYVRRTAVMGCVKLYHLSPGFVEDHGVVQKLKAMMRDEDAQVVCNCISALDEILAAEGGVEVDQRLAHGLLKRMKSMSEWGQCQVMELLIRYTPSEEQERYDILNLLDIHLKTPNGAVVMACIRLFLHLTRNVQQIQDDVLERIKAPLLTIMCSTNYELIYTTLCHIELLITKNQQLFIAEYKMFFSRFNDPQFVRRKKLQILTTISSGSNVEEIVTELSANVHDVDVELSKESIEAIGKIALAVPHAAEYCIDTLLSFLSCEIEYITSRTLMVIRDLLPQYEKSSIAVLPQLKECIELVQDPSGKAAIVWMLGEYGQCIPDSPYMLEPLVDTVEEEQSAEVKLQLLTAMMKLFFKKPPECQEILGRLLAHCIDSESHVDVHDRALLYYRLLKIGVKEAQSIVCGAGERSKRDDKDVGEMKNLKDSVFTEFNTFSVVYGQPAVNFVSQTIPYIKGQPYTQAEHFSNNVPATNHHTEKQDNAPSTTQPPKVIVGNLLGDDLSSKAESPSVTQLPLVSQPVLSPADFQQKWTTLKQSASLHVDLAIVPRTPSEFQECMLSQHIVMMASSPEGQPTQKYFHYAQQASDGAFVLIETTIEVTSLTLTAVFKTDNSSTVEMFVKHFRGSLVGSWMSLE